MRRSYTLLPGLVVFLCLMIQHLNAQGIDDIIASSYESVDEFDQLADLEGRIVRQELDMLLTKSQAQALEVLRQAGDDPISIRKRRKAVRALSYRWTNKVIPYTIASNTFSDSDIRTIKAAIADWEKYTCVKFREANRQDNNKVYFSNGNGCYSYVGMTRQGSQTIGLAPGCRHKGVVIHEIGHAVGFHHEQNRPDRDDYVRIVKENIPSKLYYNFKKYPTSAVDTMGVPYDYGSIMHYGGTAFSNNGQLTIRTIDPKDQKKIGNRNGLSYYDIMLANKMYKCSENCGNIQCPRGSFLGKDCQCWCPGYPIQRCQATGTLRPTTTTQSPTKAPSRCVNQNRNCDGWARSGYCSKNTYVKTYCKKSCGFCNEGIVTTPKYVCKDYRSNCKLWGERGFCQGTFEMFMSENCQKTCKVCGAGNSDSGLHKSEGNGSIVTASFSISALLLSSLIAVARQWMW